MGKEHSICFVIDDPSFRGGAHIATFNLINKLLEHNLHIDILSIASAKKNNCDIANYNVVWIKPKYDIISKLVRRLCGLVVGIWPEVTFENGCAIKQWMRNHDVVVNVSECSVLRGLLASLGNEVRKVQMLHTDYASVRNRDWHEKIKLLTDSLFLNKMDCIGIVGESNATRLKRAMPALAPRVKPFHNVLLAPLAIPRCVGYSEFIRIITLSRLQWGPPKNIDRLIRIAFRLKSAGIKFEWDIYGDGDRSRFDKLVKDLGVGDVCHIRGFSDIAQAKLAEADISVLMSDFEGLPNTIYESMMLGVPVFSTNVGGVAEQIKDGVNGWLVENDENKAFEKLKLVMKDKGVIEGARKALIGYRYDNEVALSENMNILGLVG